MKAITFTVRFITAQFKEHTQKLVRRTYLIPPPSTVAGFFGAILGLPLKELRKKSDMLLAGAELLSFKGRLISLSRMFKIDRSIAGLKKLLDEYRKLAELPRRKRVEVMKDIQGLLTIKESEELYMPEYKFAIASSDEILIDEGFRRIKSLDFEYEVFGGNDYHFVDFIGNVKFAKVVKTTRGRGYCRRIDLDRVEASSFSIVLDINSASRQPIVMPVIFNEAGSFVEFVQIYGADIITRRSLLAVDDGESRIFVYNVKPFLVVRI